MTRVSGPISRDIAIPLLQYPISRRTFSVGLAHSQRGAITPLWYFHLHGHIHVIPPPPFCNISRDSCAIPTLTKISTKELCDPIATSVAQYEKYRCWAHSWQGYLEKGTDELLRRFVPSWKFMFALFYCVFLVLKR